MVNSAYIHIPFCKSKCHYCSFVSFNKLELKDKYLTALENEICTFYENELLQTLYFGGGTPSLLEIPEFRRLINLFKISDKTEVTTELNPEGVNNDYMHGLLDVGINRISIGCQSFDDKILKLINRRHTAEQVYDAVRISQREGFENISLDFIYGLPEQTPEMFYSDLKKAVDLGVKHISLYGLKIEDGCYFYKNMPKNLPDDDMQADMYLGAVDLLKNLGFEHYEVSNFSLKGYNSRHNLTYWKNKEYYGFGVSAHGYKNSVRYGNQDELETYIENPLLHKEEKLILPKEKLEEEIFLGFRCILDGIDVSEINSKYSIDFDVKYNNVLKKYISLNFIEKTPNGYRLTPQGVLVSNVVLADFLE